MQALWLVAAGAATGGYTVPFVLQWQALQTVCRDPSACASNQFQLNAASARELAQHGISLRGYAAFTAVVIAVVWTIWYGLATLMIWRKPRDHGAIVAAFFLIIFPLLAGGFWIANGELLQSLLTNMPFLALFFFCLLFPDGRFRPRWTRWLAVVATVVATAGVFIGTSGSLIIFPMWLIGAAAQIYRFRSLSTWGQRQQTKWAILGLMAGILGLFAIVLPFIVANVPSDSLYSDLTNTLLPISASAIPISIAIAVLRSRLWDIDRIISRALAYTALSLTLAGIYIGTVIGLQALFRSISGQQSGLAVALSTLVVAAVFNPLRHRIQDVIARTFSRRKYNAQQVLAVFGATCRDETDLEKLKEDMIRVVGQTVQPAHVSLWLRESPRVG